MKFVEGAIFKQRFGIGIVGLFLFCSCFQTVDATLQKSCGAMVRLVNVDFSSSLPAFVLLSKSSARSSALKDSILINTVEYGSSSNYVKVDYPNGSVFYQARDNIGNLLGSGEILLKDNHLYTIFIVPPSISAMAGSNINNSTQVLVTDDGNISFSNHWGGAFYRMSEENSPVEFLGKKIVDGMSIDILRASLEVGEFFYFNKLEIGPDTIFFIKSKKSKLGEKFTIKSDSVEKNGSIHFIEMGPKDYSIIKTFFISGAQNAKGCLCGTVNQV